MIIKIAKSSKNAGPAVILLFIVTASPFIASVQLILLSSRTIEPFLLRRF